MTVSLPLKSEVLLMAPARYKASRKTVRQNSTGQITQVALEKVFAGISFSGGYSGYCSAHIFYRPSVDIGSCTFVWCGYLYSLGAALTEPVDRLSDAASRKELYRRPRCAQLYR